MTRKTAQPAAVKESEDRGALTQELRALKQKVKQAQQSIRQLDDEFRQNIAIKRYQASPLFLFAQSGGAHDNGGPGAAEWQRQAEQSEAPAQLAEELTRRALRMMDAQEAYERELAERKALELASTLRELEQTRTAAKAAALERQTLLSVRPRVTQFLFSALGAVAHVDQLSDAGVVAVTQEGLFELWRPTSDAPKRPTTAPAASTLASDPDNGVDPALSQEASVQEQMRLATSTALPLSTLAINVDDANDSADEEPGPAPLPEPPAKSDAAAGAPSTDTAENPDAEMDVASNSGDETESVNLENLVRHGAERLLRKPLRGSAAAPLLQLQDYCADAAALPKGISVIVPLHTMRVQVAYLPIAAGVAALPVSVTEDRDVRRHTVRLGLSRDAIVAWQRYLGSNAEKDSGGDAAATWCGGRSAAVVAEGDEGDSSSFQPRHPLADVIEAAAAASRQFSSPHGTGKAAPDELFIELVGTAPVPAAVAMRSFPVARFERRALLVAGRSGHARLVWITALQERATVPDIVEAGGRRGHSGAAEDVADAETGDHATSTATTTTGSSTGAPTKAIEAQEELTALRTRCAAAIYHANAPTRVSLAPVAVAAFAPHQNAIVMLVAQDQSFDNTNVERAKLLSALAAATGTAAADTAPPELAPEAWHLAAFSADSLATELWRVPGVVLGQVVNTLRSQRFVADPAAISSMFWAGPDTFSVSRGRKATGPTPNAAEVALERQPPVTAIAVNDSLEVVLLAHRSGSLLAVQVDESPAAVPALHVTVLQAPPSPTSRTDSSGRTVWDAAATLPQLCVSLDSVSVAGSAHVAVSRLGGSLVTFTVARRSEGPGLEIFPLTVTTHSLQTSAGGDGAVNEAPSSVTCRFKVVPGCTEPLLLGVTSAAAFVAFTRSRATPLAEVRLFGSASTVPVVASAPAPAAAPAPVRGGKPTRAAAPAAPPVDPAVAKMADFESLLFAGHSVHLLPVAQSDAPSDRGRSAAARPQTGASGSPDKSSERLLCSVRLDGGQRWALIRYDRLSQYCASLSSASS